MFPGFLTPVLTQLFFLKPPTTFLTCFCRGERRNYAGKKSRLNRGSNSQPPGHESEMLTTEPPGQGHMLTEKGPKTLTLFLLRMTQEAFVDSVYQDQTARSLIYNVRIFHSRL